MAMVLHSTSFKSACTSTGCWQWGWEAQGAALPSSQGRPDSGCPLPSLCLIQLQKNKEQEEQLGEMIQAYEKLCVEKSDLETELGEMVRSKEPGCLRV